MHLAVASMMSAHVGKDAGCSIGNIDPMHHGDALRNYVQQLLGLLR